MGKFEGVGCLIAVFFGAAPLATAVTVNFFSTGVDFAAAFAGTTVFAGIGLFFVAEGVACKEIAF